MNRDLDYILNYMTKYVKNIYMHDSEPMLNYKDIEIVLKHIYDLSSLIKNQEEQLKANDLMINELINRINKAIEYIEENIAIYYTNIEETNEEYELVCEPKELLDILKGENNEII